MKPKIGILGGIGAESSAKFYELLIKKAQSSGLTGNTDYPHIILESIPAPELFIGNPDLRMYTDAIINLEKAGADFIVIVCNTAYAFLDEFKRVVKTPIVDLSQELDRILKKNSVQSATIFGTRATIQLFSSRTTVINAPRDEDVKKLESVINNFIAGVGKKESLEKLLPLLTQYSQPVLIACTELSTILQGSGEIYFDTFDILLNATFDKWKKG